MIVEQYPTKPLEKGSTEPCPAVAALKPRSPNNPDPKLLSPQALEIQRLGFAWFENGVYLSRNHAQVSNEYGSWTTPFLVAMIQQL